MATPVSLPQIRRLARLEPTLDEASYLSFAPERLDELVDLVRSTLEPHRVATQAQRVVIGGRLFLRLDGSGTGQLPAPVREAFAAADLHILDDPQFAVVTGADRFLKAETFGARAAVHLDPICPTFGYFGPRQERSGVFARLLREAGPDASPERVADWLAMNLARSFPLQPGGLVFALPTEVHQDGVIGASSWPGFDTPGFFDDVVTRAAARGKWPDPIETFVVGDLELAAQEARRVFPGESLLLAWFGQTTRLAVVSPDV